MKGKIILKTGKNLFSLQGTPVLITGSLFSLQGFPSKPLYFPVRDCSVVYSGSYGYFFCQIFEGPKFFPCPISILDSRVLILALSPNWVKFYLVSVKQWTLVYENIMKIIIRLFVTVFWFNVRHVNFEKAVLATWYSWQWPPVMQNKLSAFQNNKWPLFKETKGRSSKQTPFTIITKITKTASPKKPNF